MITPKILTLPSEIRDLILRHLFNEPQIFYQRAPSRRRLRSSRIDKNDVRGVLQASRILRNEAIPIYFRKHIFVFHSFNELQEFIDDARLDITIKTNVTRIAIDVGDMKDYKNMRLSHVDTTASAMRTFSRLQSLECRIYARSDNEACLNDLNSLWEFWEEMNQAHLAVPAENEAPSEDYLKFIKSGDSLAESLITMKQQGINIAFHSVRDVYYVDPKTPNNSVDLKMCNMLISKTSGAKPLFGSLQEAVRDRRKMAGAIPMRDEELMDCDAWREDWRDWCWRNQDIIGERYH